MDQPTQELHIGTTWQRDFVLNDEALIPISPEPADSGEAGEHRCSDSSSTLGSPGQRELPGSRMEILFHEFAATRECGAEPMELSTRRFALTVFRRRLAVHE